MVMPKFQSSLLERRLETLDANGRLAFGVLCCERILPNYRLFQETAGWGNIGYLRNSLDRVSAFLSGHELSVQEINVLIASCETAAPNSDNFVCIYVATAQDACFAVCSVLDYLKGGKVSSIVHAATYATDSVDLYVQEIEKIQSTDPLLEQKILMHPLMQRELMHQEEDLTAIENAFTTGSDFLDKRKAAYGDKGNLSITDR